MKNWQTYQEDLLAMHKVDQEMRKTDPSIEIYKAVDGKHTEIMKTLVHTLHWPKLSEVGKDGMHAAWILVQHADHDVAFQRKCLTLMEELVPEKEIELWQVAYLTDRVLLNEGEMQIYGTQWSVINGVSAYRPMIEPEKVNNRRKKMHLEELPPLKQYDFSNESIE